MMDLNLTDSSLKKKYIYADRQILAQHDIDEGEEDDFKYFYLHDRLGSVRLVIDDDEGDVVKYYTYEPFGEVIEDDGTFENAFRFTGQYFDPEIEEYYLRARQYNPYLGRFTSRDPVRGKFREPLTLHRYLYCSNDPINRIDPDGEFATAFALRLIVGGIVGGVTSSLSAEDHKVRAFIVGAVAGMFSSGISNKILGVVAGIVLNVANSGHIAYINDEGAMQAGIRMITGAGGGYAGGVLFSNHGGLSSFIGGAVSSTLGGYLYGATADATGGLFEGGVRRFEENDPYRD